jgi:hypothetical protein
MKFLKNKYVDMLSRMLVLLIFEFGYECYSSDTTSETYPRSFVTQIFHSVQASHGGDVNL